MWHPSEAFRSSLRCFPLGKAARTHKHTVNAACFNRVPYSAYQTPHRKSHFLRKQQNALPLPQASVSVFNRVPKPAHQTIPHKQGWPEPHVYGACTVIFWQQNYQIHGHLRCANTVLANPIHTLHNQRQQQLGYLASAARCHQE